MVVIDKGSLVRTSTLPFLTLHISPAGSSGNEPTSVSCNREREREGESY